MHVEDNPGDVMLLREALKDSRVPNDYVVADDGDDALRVLHAAASGAGLLPDLILLDINLPRKDGWEVLRDIKQDLRLARIPVIVLTTSTDGKDVKTAYDLHASCYLSKPSDLEAFLRLARLIEEFWLIQVRFPVQS
jgi:chemotaxis family two-component system response regulator Rcp1